MIRILLADSHRLLHSSIPTFFSTIDKLILTGEVTDKPQLLQQIGQEPAPDLVLLSPNIAPDAITDTIDDLKERDPCLKIVILLAHPEEADVPTLIDHDIAGIILKSDPPEKLIEAICNIMQGTPWFSAALIPKLMQSATSKSHELTSRELEVLALLIQENTNIAIANALNISERTVRCHLESIYSKLGIISRVGAVVQAIKLNIISE